MSDSIKSLLDAFPEGVVQIRSGLVLAANDKARQYVPQLSAGAPLPEEMPIPAPGETETGFFTSGGVSFEYTGKAGEEETILLFHPKVRNALEGWQLDGTLRQLRELLGDVMVEAGAAAPDGTVSASFNKTFHRLFRLIGNLEFMQQIVEEDVPFRPMTVDLDGLCWSTVQQAGDLLQEAGVTLEYVNKTRGLLIYGDLQLLKKLLLGLISNAARSAGEGTVSVILHRRGDQARIIVTNSGGVVDERQLDALFGGGPGEGVPLPGQGAGLGLSIARHIVQMHGGTLLPFGGESAHGVLVSLPAGQFTGGISVRSPSVQRDGGLDPVLVELSDVLPAFLFGMEGLD